MRKWQNGVLAWTIIVVLLLSACGVKTPVSTAPDTTPDSTVKSDMREWLTEGEWAITFNERGAEVLTAPAGVEASAWLSGFPLEEGWKVSVTIEPVSEGIARVLLGTEEYEAEFSVVAEFDSDCVELRVETKRGQSWKALSTEKDRFDPGLPMTLTIIHKQGSARLCSVISQEGEVVLELISLDITQRMYMNIVSAGVGTDGTSVTFYDFSLDVPDVTETPVDQLLNTMLPEDDGFYLNLAEIAVKDIVANFWLGDAPAGHIIPTWDGYPGNNLPDNRGGLWEATMLYMCFYDYWMITNDEFFLELMKSEIQFVRDNFTAEELENAGGNQLWASDDCAWITMLMLNCYRISGDEWFMERAVNLADNAMARWYDEELGGMVYSDGVDHMSLYEVNFVFSWLRLWEITGVQRFYDLALHSYENMHSRLGSGRDDGLYFCEANAHFHRGGANHISEAGSSSFLAGNLGMAALAARFYKITREQEYLNRMYAVNEGLLNVYVREDGVLLNDRDAWTNGIFTAYYVTDVLTMPDTEEMQQAIRDTALSIAVNARTEDGYYGGSWSGPAEGGGSVWYKIGSTPQQSKTTGSTVLMITAAAMLEAGIDEYVR